MGNTDWDISRDEGGNIILKRSKMDPSSDPPKQYDGCTTKLKWEWTPSGNDTISLKLLSNNDYDTACDGQRSRFKGDDVYYSLVNRKDYELNDENSIIYTATPFMPYQMDKGDIVEIRGSKYMCDDIVKVIAEPKVTFTLKFVKLKKG